MSRRRIAFALTTGLLLTSLLISVPGSAASTITGPLRTAGNGIYDATNRRVVLRGLARAYLVSTPAVTPASHLTDADIAAMQSTWNTNIVRVFLGEQFWDQDECSYNSNYANAVDQVVHSITSRGMVALLDLHWNTRIPCFGAGQQRMADSPGSLIFWSQVASRYKDNPLVAFQLYNEPNHISWDVWRYGGVVVDPGLIWTAAGMQQMYNAVRATGAQNLVFVSGNDWGDTPPPPSYLISGYNIVYAAQYYTCPQSVPPWCTTPDPTNPAPAPGQGLDSWGSFTTKYPVMVTEFGWPDANSGTYNANVIAWAEAHGVGWIAFEWGAPTNTKPNLLDGIGALVSSLGAPPPNWNLLTGYAPTYDPDPAGLPVKIGLAKNL